ncbi:hypothetical protein C6P40_001641 [Pichia californica]|uniref:Zn(2)-C6 fungal-type domain-containing protein n=1 Tax=Pichia californica TaxID=460514 RepID=A0A9P6WRF5_9ASCO|nr:hypothetical protein C6P40_001641 [[Candida] californica]
MPDINQNLQTENVNWGAHSLVDNDNNIESAIIKAVDIESMSDNTIQNDIDFKNNDNGNDNDNSNFNNNGNDNDNNNDYRNGSEFDKIDNQLKSQQKLEMKRNKKKVAKSKDGCLSCKERKIKCDQKIPNCSACEKRSTQCPYLMMTPFQIHRIQENKCPSNKSPFSSITNSTSNIKEEEKKSACIPIINTSTNLKNSYGYRKAGSINSNSQSPEIYRSNHFTSKIENTSLPLSLDKKTHIYKTKSYLYDYISLKPNYKTKNLSTNNIPLYSNTRISNLSFNISHDSIFNYFNKYMNTSSKFTSYLLAHDFVSIHKILGGKNLDFILRLGYLEDISISQIYNKLLRKSLLLFSLDYYKNIILKQNMIPFATYEEKLSISGKCENESVESIDKITRIIKDEYLPEFYKFSGACVTLFLGSFIILDDCLGYHFKNGLKYDMSYDEGNKAIQLAGIFSTGYYAIVMEKSREQILMSSTNILSAFLVTNFKRFVIQNYSIKLFEGFVKIIEKSKSFFPNDTNFENLLLFCNQHKTLLEINIHKHSLIGYNNGYVIRLFNSFKSILPYDINNFCNEQIDIFLGEDKDIIIRLFYYTVGHILDALIPGLQNIVSGSFCSPLWDIYEFENIKSIMRLFNSMKDKKMKLIAIFLIRSGLFCKSHRLYNRRYLNNYTLNELFYEESETSIHQKYVQLLKFKEDGEISQVPVKSFLLDKGQFIKRWNFPNDANLKPKRSNKVCDNKIMNQFNNDEDAIIEDFTKSNNGFFTLDFDPSVDLAGSNPVSA